MGPYPRIAHGHATRENIRHGRRKGFQGLRRPNFRINNNKRKQQQGHREMSNPSRSRRITERTTTALGASTALTWGVREPYHTRGGPVGHTNADYLPGGAALPGHTECPKTLDGLRTCVLWHFMESRRGMRWYHAARSAWACTNASPSRRKAGRA